MLNAETDKGRLIAAAMRLAADRPWSEVTLRDIADEAGISLAAVREHVASKTAIIEAFTRAADEVVLREAARRQPVGSARDAIFEVIMSRFDALEPYKPALRSIVHSAARDLPDPGWLRTMLSSQHWMLEAAGVDTGGIGGVARTLGLASVYASVFRDWLADDDPGLARTMAALDRRLRRGEQNLKAMEAVCGLGNRVAGMLSRRARRSDAAAAASRERTEADAGIGAGSGSEPEPPAPAPPSPV